MLDHGTNQTYTVTTMKKLVRTLNGLPIVITVRADGYFSVTATHDRAGGCMHAEVIQAAPELSTLVALHLSDATTGVPMHAEANGWYWVAGALGGLGQRFHGANESDRTTRTTDECARILADHVRADDLTVRAILGNVKSMADMFGNVAARNWWQEWIKSQAARWSTEAEKGRKQIAAL